MGACEKCDTLKQKNEKRNNQNDDEMWVINFCSFVLLALGQFNRRKRIISNFDE